MIILIILLKFLFLYNLGGIISYTSLIVYNYYSNPKGYSNKTDRLHYAKGYTETEFGFTLWLLSYVFLVGGLIYLLYALIRLVIYKILKFILIR